MNLSQFNRYIKSATMSLKEYSKPVDTTAPVTTLLMLTWYATLTDWEQIRQLHIPDANWWARRSEMELSHWAEAGRLA